MALVLTSDVFDHGEAIPQRFSCDGEDFSPPLRWTDPPEGTRSFALIMDDPDAPMGTWVHWVLYNLPSSTRELGEDFPLDAQLSSGARNGRNSWRRMGYAGPCPPGGIHRYFFHLYALDRVLSLAPGAEKAQVLQAMHGHILAEAELMGTYQR
ncbi:MAG: YbhB/YbcL family Raf kinase inhibitor-like protein [Anaerolineales bacterium]|nr:YbhB/YbcL family Raf kinase inhibitor-like protein [Anaerolineales bacterium]